MKRFIIHSDLNSFYASVECLKKPWLKSIPLAVAGDIEQRHGIILAKNIPATAFGIKTGEPIWSAKQKCPDLVTVLPNFDDYIAISQNVRKIYEEYSDRVEAFGIDECWIDISYIVTNYFDAKLIADEIREKIKNQIGVTASCGVSFNKVFAKLASDLKKPDATTVIDEENFRDTVWKLPADSLLYVGRSTQKALSRLNIRTIGDVANTDIKAMEFMFGKNGIALWNNANGLDTSPVSIKSIHSTIKSIGNSITTSHDITEEEEIKIVFFALCEAVSARLRRLDLICNTVQIYVRDSNFNTYERQAGLSFPNRTVSSLFNTSFDLYRANGFTECSVRSLGVRAVNLNDSQHEQISIDPISNQVKKHEDLDTATDKIRYQFGSSSLKRGIMLNDSILSGNDIRQEKCSFTKI